MSTFAYKEVASVGCRTVVVGQRGGAWFLQSAVSMPAYPPIQSCRNPQAPGGHGRLPYGPSLFTSLSLAVSISWACTLVTQDPGVVE